MIACVCRNIDDSDYATEAHLRERIMQDDWSCGLCQLRYELESAPVPERSNGGVCKTFDS